MNENLAAARLKLESEGWSFEGDGHEIKGYHLLSFRSPRMTVHSIVNMPTGADFEQLLRQEEAAAVAYENHDATISAALNGVKADLLRSLAAMYRMIADGKQGVELPTEITLKELVIPLSIVRGRPANPEGEMP